jgi:molybdate transport system ATP-binding protein
MSLEVSVTRRLGAFTLDARFVSEGRLTALFGRSGSGKSSLVNVIAGLLRPERGRIVVDGTTLIDTARGVCVPKHSRRIGYVFQEGRLFPHLTVRQNLLFGRWFVPTGERSVELSTVVDLLGIGRLLDRHPAALSGGEKQRVALGRALLTSPRLLLMDEPLAALEDARKAEILPFIERLRDQSRIPIVYVSHSLTEVARLATTVVVMSEGKAAAVGSPEEILGRSELVPPEAAAEGGSLIKATVMHHDRSFGLTTLQSPAGDLQAPLVDLPIGTPVRVRVPARDVMIATEAPRGLSALNVLRGTVTRLSEAAGQQVDLDLDCGGERIAARLTRKSVGRLGITTGREVYAVVKSVALGSDSVDRAPMPLGSNAPRVESDR